MLGLYTCVNSTIYPKDTIPAGLHPKGTKRWVSAGSLGVSYRSDMEWQVTELKTYYMFCHFQKVVPLPRFPQGFREKTAHKSSAMPGKR